MTRNPFVDRLKVLGIGIGAFQAAKTQAENFLRANDDKEEVDEAAVRATVSPPVSDRIWNEVKKDLGFILVLLIVLGGCSGFNFEIQALSLKTGSGEAQRVAEGSEEKGNGKVKALP